MKSPPFGGDFLCCFKENFKLADINNIDMKNESFSYLLPKSGSRSY